jgi:hypothetical protein
MRHNRHVRQELCDLVKLSNIAILDLCETKRQRRCIENAILVIEELTPKVQRRLTPSDVKRILHVDDDEEDDDFIIF